MSKSESALPTRANHSPACMESDEAVIAIEKSGRTLCSNDNDGLNSENVMSFSKYKRATITLTAGIREKVHFCVLYLRKPRLVV